MMNTYILASWILVGLLAYFFNNSEQKGTNSTQSDDSSQRQTPTREDTDQRNLGLCNIPDESLEVEEYGIPSFCFRERIIGSIDPSIAGRLIEELDDPKALQNLIRASTGDGRIQALEMVNQLENLDLSERKLRAIVGPLVNSFGGAGNLSPQDITTLGRSLLQKMPGKYIKELPKESFDAFVGGMFDGEEIEDVLSETDANALCSRAFHFYKTIETEEDFDKILPLLPCAPVSLCDQIPTQFVKTRVANISDLPWQCASRSYTDEDDEREVLKDMFPQMAGCAKLLAKKLINNTLDLETFERMGSLQSCLETRNLRSLVPRANCSELTSIAERVDLFKDAKVKRAVKAKCSSARISQPENMTATDLLEMGSLAVELGKNVLKKLDRDALCDSRFISMVKRNRNAPENIRQAVAKRCYKNKVLTEADISDMGSEILLKLDIRKLKQSVGNVTLDSNTRRDLKNALKSGKTDRRIKTLRRELQEKFPVKDLVDSPEIMREMPLNRLRSEVSDIRQDLGLNDNSTSVDLPDTVSKWGVAQWIRTNPPQNITADNLREMKTLVRGFLSSHIKGLNKEDLLYSASVLCETSNWPDKTVRAITNTVIRAYLKDFNSTNPMSALSITDVSVIGPECLMYLTPEEIWKAGTDVCIAICEKIGSSDKTFCLPHQRRASLKDTCLKCLGKHDTPANITEEDLDTLGHALASEMTEEFARIDAATIRNRVSIFKHGCRSGHFLESIGPKLRAAFGPAGDLDGVKLLELGGLIGAYAEGTSLDEVDQVALADMAEEIMEDLSPSDERRAESLRCCLRGITESELQEVDRVKRAVFSSVVSAMDSNLNQNATARRKKREGSLWTCDDISSMGPSITSVSIADLQAIDSTEFYNCLGVMSQYSDWEVSKRDAMFQKVIQDVGDICNMTTTDVVSVGSFLLSATEEIIACLPLAEDDLVATVGSMSEWSTAQLESLALRYLSERSVNVSSLANSEVATMGHILCGVNASDLSQLTSAAFVGASAQIGRLTSCDTARLQVLKETAARQDALGSIDSWGAEIFSEIGVITGGFTAQEIQSLSVDSIEGIPDYAIPLIPANIFAELSTDQLSNFSFAQANAMTSGQRQALSANQLSSIESVLSLEDESQSNTNVGGGREGGGRATSCYDGGL